MRLTKKELLLFFAVALVFLLIEIKGLLLISPGDENTYFYMAKAISEGQIPYKDFFYAHPPLHILILSLVVKIFGTNFAVLKSSALIAMLISSFFVYKTSLELLKNRLNDKNYLLISFVCLFLYLFSFEILFKGTFSLGIEFSLMFLQISFYLFLTNRHLSSGIFAGLAGLMRLYTLPIIFGMLIFLFVKKIHEKKIKDILFFVSGFFATFMLTIVILTFTFGSKFTYPVFAYHLLKAKLPGQRITVYKNVLKDNWPIYFAFSLSVFIKNKKRFHVFYFIIFIYFLFLLSLNVPADHYFMMPFSFMAITGGYSIVELIRRVRFKYLKYSLAVLLFALFLWNTVADVMFLERFGFLKFSPISQMVDKIYSTDTNQILFGDDGIVSLLAFITNRKIALNYIDSNEMRFTSGLSNYYIFRDDLDKVNLSYIIYRENRGLHQIKQFREYADGRCKLDSEYTDLVEGIFLFYKC